ncbi:MAG: MMPL family transporter [Chloroflexota bacterium]|nr:MMPL family transporter [Chloroflexota bacterium]
MTGYLARISARRPLVTMAIWLVIALVAGGLSQALLDSATTTELKLGSGARSQQAAQLLEDRLRGPEPITEIVIVQSENLTVDDPAFKTKVETVFGQIVALGPEAVTAGLNYYLTGDERQVSPDRRTTLMPFRLVGDLNEAEGHAEHILDIVEAADGVDGFRVLTSGTASISVEQNELALHDLEQGERIGIPVALLILVALFGTVVAALAPIGLAIVAIVVALGLVALIGQAFQLVFFVTLMVTMIGLAVGIDYSLLIVSRFREEMEGGLDKLEATERSGSTAGRTVLFSGLTVIIALCGMLIVPFPFFQSLAVGAILVVAIALAATLTLLPAVLAVLGPRVNLLPVPLLGRFKVTSPDHSKEGFWEFITQKVMRYPVISILAIAVPMIVLTVFYFDIKTGLSGVDAFPEGSQSRDAFFVLEENFSFGIVNPVEVVVDGNVNSPEVQGAIQRLQASLSNDPRFPFPPVPTVNDAGDLALLTLVIGGEPSSQAAVDTVVALRDEYIPAAFEGVSANVLVGGVTAITADVFEIVEIYTPFVFLFVLGFSFIVLMLVFRSIVIPIKAVIMNLLSVGASYGLLVLVFQKDVATDLLGFRHAEVVDAWIPLFLFSILFGLSMDYHVFLLSRIRERYDHTGDNAEAVAYGLRSTAGIITGAALIMVAVFGGFALGETIINQQVGFGLAVAVFLDATLVRSVLVPASMEVLGKRNWYLPSFLSWLPDVRVEPAEDE